MANNKSVKSKKGENMTLMSINVEEIISDLIHLHKSGANDDILALCERYSPLFTAQRFNFEKKPPNGYRLFLHARGLKLAALPLRERGTTVIPVWSKLKRSNQAYYNNRALKLALLQRAIHEASSNQGLSVLTNLTESEIKMWTTQDDKAAEKFDRMEIQAFDRKTACNLKKTRRTVPIVMTPNDDDDDCDGDNYIPAASRREVINEPRRRLGRPKKEVAKGASGNAEPRSRASQRPKRMVKKRVDDAFVLVCIV